MRLFVGTWPPETLANALPTAATLADDLRWVPVEQRHVTLRFLGECASAGPVIDALRAAALPGASAQLGDPVRRLGPQAAVVPVTGLDDLAGAVNAATAGLGAAAERRRFTGHLTLARSRRGRFGSLIGTPVEAGRWPVRTIRVVRSHLDHTGARYETLAEIELPKP